MAECIEREAALEICETEYQKRLRMFDYCGDTVAWNIGHEIKALPAADVVPVSEMFTLRDALYENDQITMRGLARLNMLIAKYGGYDHG